MNVRRLGIAIGLVTLGASGAYALIYLARWEWNRAIIAALLFLAMELAFAVMIILSRITRLERRMEGLVSEARTHARVRESAPSQRNPLKWLNEDETGVFVPVLMGAGVIVSLVAMGVERVAQRTAGASLEPALANRLRPLVLPPPGRLPVPMMRSEMRRRAAVQTLLLLVLTIVLSAGVDALGDLTQTRPEPSVPGARTFIVMQVEANSFPTAPVEVATRLWESCRGTLTGGLTPAGIQALTGRTVRMEIDLAIGERQERRLRGCFEDATLDNVRAQVLSVERIEPGAAPSASGARL